MKSSTLITSTVLFLGLAMAAPGPNADVMARDGQQISNDTVALAELEDQQISNDTAPAFAELDDQQISNDTVALAELDDLQTSNDTEVTRAELDDLQTSNDTEVTRAELETRTCIINGPDNCHGERTCVLGGISCKYADGSRCAKLVSNDGTFTAFCPNGHWDNGVYHDIYVGADCISAFTALGRHRCS